MTLEDAINECISVKNGNKEFALFYTGEEWMAEIGNPCASVMLGESSGEFSAYGGTALEAVNNLLKCLATLT